MSILAPIVRPLALTPGWAKNELWRKARAVPSLDLRFAESKSLVDAYTGQNLVTHTRASSGTFVGSDGVIQTAVTNLLPRSEEWDNASWTKTNSSVTSNAATAPNGTTTADALIEDTAASTHVALQAYGVTTGATYTLSCYAKAAGRNFAQLLFIGGFASNITAIFDLTNGNVGATGGSPVTTAVAVGNGWYRLSITATATSTTTTSVQLRPAITSSAANYQGDGTSGIYLWGAQLEQSSSVGEYVPTTSVINSAPRFDHNPTTGESLGLLVEEQRTNSIRNNTMQGAVAGTPGTNPTNWIYVTTQSNGLTQSIVGTGTENGITYIDYRFNGTTVTSPSPCAIGIDSTTAATAQTWTASTYWKLAAGTTAGTNAWQIGLIESTAGGTFVGGAFYSQTAPTSAALITQRPTATRTLSGGGTVGTIAMPINIIVAGNTAIDFTLRIGLPQLELGAFATSVIPTTTAAVTRSADVVSITGTNFSSWYRQDEGTIYADLVTASRGHSAFPRLVAFLGSDVNSGNEASIYTRNTGGVDDYRLLAGYWDAVGATADFNPGSSAPLGSGRAAMGVKLNDGAYCVNGATIFTDTSCAIPTPVQVRLFGQARFQPNTSGYIRRLTYFPRRLPDSTLQAITQ